MNGLSCLPGAGDGGRFRIAFVMPPWFDVPPEAYGGIELVVADLIDALVGRGHDVVMVGAGQNGTRARFLRTYETGGPSQRCRPGPPVSIASRGR